MLFLFSIPCKHRESAMSQSIQNLVCCTLTQNRRPQGCATDFRGRNWQLLPSGAQNERKGLSSGNPRLSMETAEINEQVAIRCTFPGSGELTPQRLSLRHESAAIHLHQRYFGLLTLPRARIGIRFNPRSSPTYWSGLKHLSVRAHGLIPKAK